MIDYKEAKKYLLPTLLDYGFKERKDKSCKSCLVFSDGSETLLVYRNQRGIYDHYVNKSASDDYGDAVHFIMKRVLNKTTNLSAEDFCKYGQTNEKYKEDSRKSSTAYRKPITYSRASNFGSKNEM